MINIIKADLFRIFTRKAIYILLLVIITLGVLSTYTISPPSTGLNLSNDYDSHMGLSEEWYQKAIQSDSLNETREIVLEHGGYEADVASVAHNSVLYYLFIVIVEIIITCDFAHGSIKNTVSTNISKRKYYFSKLIVSLGLGTALIVINTYFIHFSNLIVNGSKFVTSLSNITILMLQQLPAMFAMISILVMISVIVKKGGRYDGITIPLVMVFQLLLMSAINLFHLPNDIFNYEFEATITRLCYNPTTEYLIKTLSLWSGIFALTTVIGYTYFKKHDI